MSFPKSFFFLLRHFHNEEPISRRHSLLLLLSIVSSGIGDKIIIHWLDKVDSCPRHTLAAWVDGAGWWQQRNESWNEVKIFTKSMNYKLKPVNFYLMAQKVVVKEATDIPPVFVVALSGCLCDWGQFQCIGYEGFFRQPSQSMVLASSLLLGHGITPHWGIAVDCYKVFSHPCIIYQCSVQEVFDEHCFAPVFKDI